MFAVALSAMPKFVVPAAIADKSKNPLPMARVLRFSEVKTNHLRFDEYFFGRTATVIERKDKYLFHACNKAPTDIKFRSMLECMNDADLAVVHCVAGEHRPMVIAVPAGSSRMFICNPDVKVTAHVIDVETLMLLFTHRQ